MAAKASSVSSAMCTVGRGGRGRTTHLVVLRHRFPVVHEQHLQRLWHTQFHLRPARTLVLPAIHQSFTPSPAERPSPSPSPSQDQAKTRPLTSSRPRFVPRPSLRRPSFAPTPARAAPLPAEDAADADAADACCCSAFCSARFVSFHLSRRVTCTHSSQLRRARGRGRSGGGRGRRRAGSRRRAGGRAGPKAERRKSEEESQHTRQGAGKAARDARLLPALVVHEEVRAERARARVARVPRLCAQDLGLVHERPVVAQHALARRERGYGHGCGRGRGGGRGGRGGRGRGGSGGHCGRLVGWWRRSSCKCLRA